MSGVIKKWLMLQMWRVQQVAQILTIAMLAITLSLTVYDKMSWREGIFSTPYTGVLVILLVLTAAIWIFAFIWDMRLKMWREQMTVLAEKNPFTKEKLTPKEVLIFGSMWLPLLERLGKDDPEMRVSAANLRRWIERSIRDDSVTRMEVGTVLEYIGASEGWLTELDKK